jgi:hypothetical protein
VKGIIAGLVVLVAIFGYMHYRNNSGKMSPAHLEKILANDPPYIPMKCGPDPTGNWDYVCRGEGKYSGDFSGFNVTRDHIKPGGGGALHPGDPGYPGS